MTVDRVDHEAAWRPPARRPLRLTASDIVMAKRSSSAIRCADRRAGDTDDSAADGVLDPGAECIVHLIAQPLTGATN